MNPSDLVAEIINYVEDKDLAVLIYYVRSPAWSVAKVKMNCITEDEMRWLQLDADGDWCTCAFHHHGNNDGHAAELVHRALAIGFEFPDEASRVRFSEMRDFEMVRRKKY